MQDIETKAVHVKISPLEAVDCKKNLLEIQLHSLDILKALISLKELRKAEFKLKTEAKSKMREMAKEINRILVILPIAEELPRRLFKEKEKTIRIATTKPEAKEKSRIEAELKEIKKQLEKLG